jgi:hypothetical protein
MGLILLPLHSSLGQTQPSKQVRWTPKKTMGSARNTLSGGRRGRQQASCDARPQAQSTTLSLLVPSEPNGLYTIAAQPSLFWHVRTSQPVSARFILSDPSQAEPVFAQTLSIVQTGVAQVSLPVALKPNTQYRWAVIVACPNGSEIHARSFIQHLDRGVAPQGAPIEQAIAYAHAGIWYDALNTLMQAKNANPAAQSVLQSLLTDANVKLAPN